MSVRDVSDQVIRKVAVHTDPSIASTSISEEYAFRIMAPLYSGMADEITLGYTGSDLTTVVYKKSSATLFTLTLAYTGSNLTSITRS